VKIAWKGKEYPLAEKLTGGDVLLCERKIGLDMNDWSRLAGTVAFVFASVHKVDPAAMEWDELVALDPDELSDLLVEEPGDREPGGKEPADPLVGGSPTTRSSKGGRAGRPAAAARSKSASGRTSST
jgi:hypothetical protein